MANPKNWKHGKYVPMELVWCPDSNEYRWANPSKPGEFRCTFDGATHSTTGGPIPAKQ